MRNSMAKAPMWQGKYPTTDTAHFDDLQMRADINEHMHRMPRAEAEAAAHRDYRKDQIVEAASHHYVGMKAAHAAGNEEAAKKHGFMYALAMHQLGHKDLMNPPDEVIEHTKKTPSKDIASFKAHKGDVFTMPPEEPGDEPKRGGNEKQVKDSAAMKKAEDESTKCIACGGPYHPSTGHLHQADAPVCGPCTKHFVTWLKSHTKRKWGGEDFYEAAKTSIKPGDGDK